MDRNKLKEDLLTKGEVLVRVESYNDYKREAGVEISLYNALTVVESIVLELGATNGYCILVFAYMYTDNPLTLYSIPDSDIRPDINGLDIEKYQANVLENTVRYSRKGFEMVWGFQYSDVTAAELKNMSSVT